MSLFPFPSMEASLGVGANSGKELYGLKLKVALFAAGRAVAIRILLKTLEGRHPRQLSLLADEHILDVLAVELEFSAIRRDRHEVLSHLNLFLIID